MDALVNLLEVVNSRDLKGVRQLYDEVEANVRALSALGRDVEEYGELLLPLLFHKIPKEIRLNICNKVPKQNWKFEAVLKEFKAELENRERCEYVAVLHSNGSLVKEDQRTSSTKKVSGKGPSTASSLLAGSEGGVKPTCVYRRQPHPSVQCTVVTNVQKCRDILKNSGRCFVCIRRSHISRNFPSRLRCNKCQGRHHSSICEASEKSAGSVDPVTQKPESKQTEENEASSVMCIGTKNTVLLQTAKAVIHSPDNPDQKLSVGVIFDGGSQRLYVTERIRNALKLLVLHSESLMIKPFGSSSGTPCRCYVVSLCMGTDTGEDLTFSAICVPVVSFPVQGQFPGQATKSYENPEVVVLRFARVAFGLSCSPVLLNATLKHHILKYE